VRGTSSEGGSRDPTEPPPELLRCEVRALRPSAPDPGFVRSIQCLTGVELLFWLRFQPWPLGREGLLRRKWRQPPIACGYRPGDDPIARASNREVGGINDEDFGTTGSGAGELTCAASLTIRACRLQEMLHGQRSHSAPV
jgi:hypothetical protein